MSFFDKIKDGVSALQEKIEDKVEGVKFYAEIVADEVREEFTSGEVGKSWQEVKVATRELVQETKIGVGIDDRSDELACDEARDKALAVIEEYKKQYEIEQYLDVDLETMISRIDVCFTSLVKQLNFGCGIPVQLRFGVAPDIDKGILATLTAHNKGVRNHDVVMVYKAMGFSRMPKGFLITRDRLAFRGEEAFDFVDEDEVWESIRYSDLLDDSFIENVRVDIGVHNNQSVFIETRSGTHEISLGLGIKGFRAALVSLWTLYKYFEEIIEKYSLQRERALKVPLHHNLKCDFELLNVMRRFVEYKVVDGSDSYYVAPRIPRTKIASAVKAYAESVRPHEVLMLYDGTLFGSARTGFVITRNALYAKSIFDNPLELKFDDVIRIPGWMDGVTVGEGKDEVSFDICGDRYTIRSGLDFCDFVMLVGDILRIKGDYQLDLSRVDLNDSKYFSPDGTPQVIEAPRDQYDAAVKIVQDKIRQGQVSGITDSKRLQNSDGVVEGQPFPDIRMDAKHYRMDYGAGVASNLEATTQIQKYHNQRGGHGFAAEDANALNDRLSFKSVEKIGEGNEKNGADRIINGQYRQVKYYSAPKASIDAAFDEGRFKYFAPDGTPQVIEVPRDQYDAAVKIMQDKIRQGQVPGISDPGEAEKIVQKGSVTYEQARNIAKAGNIDSLWFDAKNQIVISTFASGISFSISIAQGLWAGENVQDAVRNAVYSSIQVGSTAFLTGIATSQLLRIKFFAGLVKPSRDLVNKISTTDIGKWLVSQLASASKGKALSGAAAANHTAKLLRTNLITASVTLGISTAPNLYRAAFARNISWREFSKNLITNVGTIGGGSGGMLMAALISSNPFLVGAMVLVGSQVGSKISASLSDKLGKSDAEEMLEILNDQVAKLASDHMLRTEESYELLHEVMLVVDVPWLRFMYASGEDSVRERIVYYYFKPYCEYLLEKRGVISLSLGEIESEMEGVLEGLAAEAP